MVVRKIGEADLKQCLAIYNYYIENSCHTFEERPLTPAQFKERAQRISQTFPFFVAEQKGAVLGYGYLDSFNDRSAYRFTADLSLYVGKERLRQGIGSALLAELENRARQAGLKNMISVITSSNENSLRFHEKHGFLCRGELENVGFKFGKWLSVKYYQKELL